MFPTGSNVSIFTNFCGCEGWRNEPMDLTALYGMQQPSFLPYLYAYHPYNNFPMSSYQSYFCFGRNFTSQFTLDPYFAFNYYECLDAKDLYASLFGKHCHSLSRTLNAYTWRTTASLARNYTQNASSRLFTSLEQFLGELH